MGDERRALRRYPYGRPISSYLDVGTGTGEVLRLFSRLAAEQGVLSHARGLGIDVSEEMIKIASKKLKGMPNVQVERRSVYDDELGSARFDFAICRNSFHHFFDPGKALQAMRRLVKANGRIFIIEGVAPDEYTLSRWKDVLIRKDVGRNPRVLLSMENVGEIFRNEFHWPPSRIEELTPVPVRLNGWLYNAPITIETRREIIRRVNILYNDPRFRRSFGLSMIRVSPRSRREYEFLKRSVLIEFTVGEQSDGRA